MINTHKLYHNLCAAVKSEEEKRMNIEITIRADSIEEMQAALAEFCKKPATHITVIPDDPRVKNGELTIPAGTDLTIAKVSMDGVQLTAAPDPQPTPEPEPAKEPEKPKRTRKAAAKAAESAQEAAVEPEAPKAEELTAAPEPAAETPVEPAALGSQQYGEPQAATPAPTLDQIAAAGAALLDADAGKMMPLLDLLKEYNVQAITQLKPEQLGSFAEKLRALGAEI